MVMMVLAIMLPLLTVGIVSLTRFTAATEHAVDELLDDLVDLTSKLIETELEKAHLLGSVLSENNDFIRLASGEVILRNRVHETLLASQSQNSDIIEMLIVTDSNGRSLTASNDLNSNIDVSDRDYVIDALSGQAGQSAVIISRATNVPVIAIAYPLVENNRIVGTLIATVKFENISRHARAISVFDEGYAFLFNSAGLTLSHINPAFDFEMNMYDIGVPELNQMIESVKNGQGGRVYYTYAGDYKQVRYEAIGDIGLAITANYDDYMATMIRIRWLLIGVIVAAILVAVSLSYAFVSKGITSPLSKISELMEKAGEGDLTVRSEIKTRDEIEAIGNSFNAMIRNQNEIVYKVKNGSKEVSQSSEDISSSTNDISDASQNIAQAISEVAENSNLQSRSIVETSETLLQLSSLIQLAKARAVEAFDNVKQSLKQASEGRESVKTTMEAIDTIKVASMTTDKHLAELVALSTQITGISGTINGIAGQTNLLALNASIEAARAGEHGRGFAVVADEVRKLAEQTGAEASGITTVVDEMNKRIQEAVDSMNKGNSAVEAGVEKATFTDRSFLKIVDAVNLISSSVEKIVEVTDDEVASSEKILKLIDSVATLSETNGASSEEVASSVEEQTALFETIAAGSEELTAMANELYHLVEKFKVKEGSHES